MGLLILVILIIYVCISDMTDGVRAYKNYNRAVQNGYRTYTSTGGKQRYTSNGKEIDWTKEDNESKRRMNRRLYQKHVEIWGDQACSYEEFCHRRYGDSADEMFKEGKL